MSVQSEITRINNNVASAYSAVGSKGGTLPAVQNSANLAASINSISGGGGAYDITQTIDGDTCTLAIVDAQGGGGGIPMPVTSDATVVVTGSMDAIAGYNLHSGTHSVELSRVIPAGTSETLRYTDCVGIGPNNGVAATIISVTPLDGAREVLFTNGSISGGVRHFYYLYKNCTFNVYITSACFLPDTSITLADGSTKQAKDITYSDRLKVWDFDKGSFGESSICWITRTGQKNDHYYKITFSNGSVCKFTGDRSNHKIYDITKREFVGVAYMDIGDKVFSENGIVTITNKEYIEEECEYYNLITRGNINCFCNGILASDRYGNMYPIDEDMKYIKNDRPIRPYSEFEPYHIKKYWYDNLRLGELTDSMDDVINYINKLECLMRPLPNDFEETDIPVDDGVDSEVI